MTLGQVFAAQKANELRLRRCLITFEEYRAAERVIELHRAAAVKNSLPLPPTV